MTTHAALTELLQSAYKMHGGRGKTDVEIIMRGIKSGSEDELQAAYFEWVDLYKKAYPALRTIYAIPNGGKRPMLTAVRMKATGTRRGVPDVHIPVSMDGEPYHSLYVEFKLPKKTQTLEQKEWFRMLRDHGHKCEIAYSWTEAAKITAEYLGHPEIAEAIK